MRRSLPTNSRQSVRAELRQRCEPNTAEGTIPDTGFQALPGGMVETVHLLEAGGTLPKGRRDSWIIGPRFGRRTGVPKHPGLVRVAARPILPANPDKADRTM